MPPNDNARSDETNDESTRPAQAPASHRPKILSAFAVPAPIKHLFKNFPLVTYPANELPLSAPKHRDHNVLYIFTTASDAAASAPSFNPGCLKWQTFLKFNDIPFLTSSSSNHASPSGALPFLLPASNPQTSQPQKPMSAIPSTKLEAWLKIQPLPTLSKLPSGATPKARKTTNALRDSAYTSLLNRIRLAYLHALYLQPQTFTSVVTPLYIHPCSRNSIVQRALAAPLRAAALDQVLAGAGGGGPIPRVDVEQLYVEAEEAFEALSTLLATNMWFASSGQQENEESETSREARHEHLRHKEDEMGKQREWSTQQRPGLLDAAVFAYTYVILSLFTTQEAGSPAARLIAAIERRQNLVDHRTRIVRKYYSG